MKPQITFKQNNLEYAFVKLWDGLNVIVRFSTIKKLFNLFHCQIEYKLNRSITTSYPYEINVDPINVCNLHCPNCRTGAGVKGRAAGSLPFPTFKQTIDTLKEHLYLVSLFSHGEPFLCKDLLAMIRYAHQQKMAVLVHTNLSFKMDASMAQEIITSGITFLSISIDGATQENYQKFRTGGDIALVLKNIDLLNEARKKLGRKAPPLIWQYLLYRENQEDLKTAAALAREKNMRFRILRPKAALKDQATKPLVHQKTHREGRPCHYLWSTLSLTSDGAVAPCCQAYDPKDDLGAHTTEKFHELWNNPRFIESRDFFNPRKKGPKNDKILCYWCPEDFFWKDVKR